MLTGLLEGLRSPAVVRAAGSDLADVMAENRAALLDSLHGAGALLFRGFGVVEPDHLHAAVRAFSGELLDYTERSSPRTSIAGNVFTSTEYPKGEEIFLHNECSYQVDWPMRVFFNCVSEPTSQGATPLADTREVLRHIDPAVVEEFRARRWMYVRNFGEMGGAWQYYFDTEDRGEVERYCGAQVIDIEWTGAEGLRTRAVRDALHRHPVTGEELWFNHATFFHVRTLPEVYREELLAAYDEADLPSNTYYGDGGRIPDEVVDHLQEAYRAARFRFDWERGDVVVVDNMLTAHGREPFDGPRRIAIAMAESSRARQGAAA
jgi:alpha-ketoglutarate-dependent taurine dioxygenase